MNPAYMSRQFKMQTGYGLLDYINKVRIEAAKKLLKNDSDNLENIAKNVGYSNARTFTRAFVKIEGITPGKYKGTMLTD
jgi:YesN/AraC family two-component response regulator